MGCLNSSINKPPMVVRPFERKKRSNQVLLTELSDLDARYHEPKIPTLVGRRHGTHGIMQEGAKDRIEKELQMENVSKMKELRRKQEEQLRRKIEEQKVQFKLRKEEDVKFKVEQDRVKVEESRSHRAERTRSGEILLDMEDSDLQEKKKVTKTGWGLGDIIVDDLEEDPEPRPPTYRKSDIVTKLSEFQTFDAYAKDAPPRVATSVSSLVNHFKDYAENQFQLVRMFYRWITFNISFDVEGYYGDDQPESVLPDDVLVARKTTSEGYANLMEAMCRYAGILARVVPGLVKGYDHQIGELVNLTDSQLSHAWNAVYINGNWFLVDCTWGAGHVNRHHKWHKKFQEFYFIVDPDKMIVDHFPFIDNDFRTSAPWQLLTSPISANSFNQRLKLERAALEWDIKPVTHTQHHIITVRKEVSIEMQEVGPTVEDYSIQFQRKDGSRNLEQFFFAYRLNERSLRIVIRPPEEIDYVLNILGRKSNDTVGEPDLLITYILKCVEVEFQLRTFPVSYKLYGAIPGYAKYGFCSDLTMCVEYTTNTGEMMLPFKVKRSVRCMCKLEHITEKADLTNYCFVVGKEHGISIKVRLPHQGYYKFTLFGKLSENGNFRPVATFLFDCFEVTHVHSGFPVAFEAAIDLKCSLYKPLWKDLPANSQITIVLGCPRLYKATVMFTALKRDENHIFEGTVTTPPAGQPFTIYGQTEESSPMVGLYHFTIY